MVPSDNFLGGEGVSGFQEILIVAGIVLAILFLPRVMGSRRVAPEIQRPAFRLSGRLRMAIAASVVYPGLIATLVQPWNGEMARFLYLGLGPVVLGWLLYWIIDGFKKKNK